MNAPTASGSDCSIFIAEMLRMPYGSGTGSATTAGCPLIGGAMRQQRHVVGLQRVRIAGHHAARTRRSRTPGSAARCGSWSCSFTRFAPQATRRSQTSR